MPGGGRKKPFSGKQKKQQLLAKRDRNHSRDRGEDGEGTSRPRPVHSSKSGEPRPGRGLFDKPGSDKDRQQHKNEFSADNPGELSVFGDKFFEVKQPTTRATAGKYSLIFRKESNEEIDRQKQLARKALSPVLDEYLECKIEDFFNPELDFPVRPPWDYKVSRDQLERTEHKYFHAYLKKIDEKFERTDLSYFELNLETWRQLWRVLEMSDIVLVVVDIRYPALLFPPKLYSYVCKELNKHLIVVLNKIDLCPAPVVLAWKEYFKLKYPELDVLCFTSYPSYNLHGNAESLRVRLRKAYEGLRKKGRMKMAAEGALELYKVCSDIVKNEVELSSWKAKIQEEMNSDIDADDEEREIENVVTEKVDTGFYDFKKFGGGILTIGCLGQPNVGKSSLINALMGKKVVSVSRTPGHTKHFQTIFLTPTVRLCDCPGLIFPSKIPKPLQVLCGSYPIAQLREPYSTVKYLAERLDLIKILRITHPEGDSVWSACDIADGWATKRGYYTAKAARLDTYRGANHILRMALEGRICLYLYPPGYHAAKDTWENDERLAEILHVQAKSKTVVNVVEAVELSDSDEEEDQSNAEESAEEPEKEPTEGSNETPGETDEKSNRAEPSKPAKAPSAVKVHNKFAMLLQSDDEDEDE